MATRTTSPSSEERPDGELAGKGNTRETESSEPGTQGPAGPLDDQPQREDEYLSSVLKEFNPQRKGEKAPLSGAERDNVVKPDENKSSSREQDDFANKGGSREQGGGADAGKDPS